MPQDRQRELNSIHDAALLEGLLEAPPPSREYRLRPATLRSVRQQRAIALRGYLRQTWVDRTLSIAERALLVAAFAAFTLWLGDGPIRDWLHMGLMPRTAAAPAIWQPAPQMTIVPAPSPPQTTEAANEGRAKALISGRGAPALPYVTASEHQRAPDDSEAFLVPGSIPARDTSTAPQPTRLTIPALGVDTPIVETFVVDGVWQVAEYAAGYMSGTALPATGNTALACHAGLRGAVFRDLGQLRVGDSAFLDAGGWRYEYRVREALTVWPTQVEVLDPTPSPVLTLVTCVNWDTQRLVVVADLVDAAPLAAR